MITLVPSQANNYFDSSVIISGLNMEAVENLGNDVSGEAEEHLAWCKELHNDLTYTMLNQAERISEK